VTVRMFTGDCREVLTTLPDASVHCCVTSPPYYQLRDYQTGAWEGGDPECSHVRPFVPGHERPGGTGGNMTKGGPTHDAQAIGRHAYRAECGLCGAVRIDRQIGLEEHVEDYVAALVDVFREVRRVLRDDGTVFLNLGDSYAGSWGAQGRRETPATLSRNQITNHPKRASNTGTIRDDGLKPKDLIGIPWLVAKALQAPYYTGRIAKESDRAYLAGFLDGEGSVTYIERDRGEGRSPTHDVRVSVNNTVRSVLEDYVRLAGGRIYERKDAMSNRFSKKQCYRWQACTEESLLLIRELYPYLRVKRKQAVLAWTLATTRHRNKNERTTDALLEKRRYIVSLIRSLNRGEDVGLPSWVEEPPSMIEPGWYLRSHIIWSKPNPMPESVRDRPTKSHEYIFLLTKSPRYFWDAEAVSEPVTDSTRERVSQPNLEQQTGSFRVPGKTNGPMKAVIKKQDGHGRRHEGFNGRYFSQEQAPTRNIRSVWTIATAPFAEAHFATFPPALAERCIKAGTSEKGACSACAAPWIRVLQEGDKVQTGNGRGPNAAVNPNRHPGEEGALAFYVRERETTAWQPSCHCDAPTVPCVVLDPFGGAGTTSLVADRLGRDSIYIDLSSEYAAMARKRIYDDAPMFAAVEVS
jgi:DNA modification methylase